MKILLVLSNFPYEPGEAIEVVAHEVLRLISEQGHTLKVQVIIRDARSAHHESRHRHALSAFSGTAVEFLDPLYLPEWRSGKGGFWSKFGAIYDLFWSLPLLRRRINHRLFPASVLLPEMKKRVSSQRPDVIFSIWSWEALAATYDIEGVPKFVYYGNPDDKPQAAQLRYPELFGLSGKGLFQRLASWKRRLVIRALGIQHVRMMNHCEETANNSLADATYYRDNGHPKSIYLQNMWPKAKSEPVMGGLPESRPPYKVIASVGNLGATGNTFGLYCLGRDLAPSVDRRMGSGQVSFDVLGGGKPSAAVAAVLKHPSIRLRGWVDDIEAEILSSYAFLVLTNAGDFIVGNTRILLAWSLGSCLIAHRNSALSMPEIEHGKNALLGETAEELAGWVEKSIKDADLRRRIGQGGFETYQQYYRSDFVVPKMLKEMELLTNARRAQPAIPGPVKAGV